MARGSSGDRPHPYRSPSADEEGSMLEGHQVIRRAFEVFPLPAYHGKGARGLGHSTCYCALGAGSLGAEICGGAETFALSFKSSSSIALSLVSLAKRSSVVSRCSSPAAEAR